MKSLLLLVYLLPIIIWCLWLLPRSYGSATGTRSIVVLDQETYEYKYPPTQVVIVSLIAAAVLLASGAKSFPERILISSAANESKLSFSELEKWLALQFDQHASRIEIAIPSDRSVLSIEFSKDNVMLTFALSESSSNETVEWRRFLNSDLAESPSLIDIASTDTVSVVSTKWTRKSLLRSIAAIVRKLSTDEDIHQPLEVRVFDEHP